MVGITPNSYSFEFLKKVCSIIGEFIENSNLHNETAKLIDIIIRFDNSKQEFVKAFHEPSHYIEREEFCQLIMWIIRYIFSKLGRLLNLREQTNKWLVKDNSRLLKTITKVHPNFPREMKVKGLKLINMDSHLNKNSKFELLFFFKKIIVQWRKKVDYETLIRNEVPYVWCRICLKEVLAISAEEHTTLCLKRYHAKKKTREIDTKLLDISNKITNEISSEVKTKSNSALLKKRNILESNKFQRKSAINTPQISIRNKEKLDHQPTVEEIKIATSSIQLWSLNKKRNSNISNGNS